MRTVNGINCPSELEVNEAFHVINADYWSDVRGIAAELKRMVKDGECEDEGEFGERLDEQCDVHQRVIYTQQARLGLCCCDNVDAYKDEMGEEPPTIVAQMFMALRADVAAMVNYDDVVAELEEEKAS